MVQVDGASERHKYMVQVHGATGWSKWMPQAHGASAWCKIVQVDGGINITIVIAIGIVSKCTVQVDGASEW